MPLFKTGVAINDQYAACSTEQLIHIVTDKQESSPPGVVETARRILLGRWLDYRTKVQKAAQQQLHAINTARVNTATAMASQPRVRPYQQRTPSKGSSIKGWHWFLIIFFIIRMVGCLVKFGQH